MDKRTTRLISLLFVLSAILVAGYLSLRPEKPDSLKELQQEACMSADLGGTCGTKLSDLEFISADECCREYGKCCAYDAGITDRIKQ